MKPFYLIALYLILKTSSQGQVSGTVFRDFNANGKRESSGSFNENGVPGIIVSAYNNLDVIVASYKTNASGI